MSEKKKSIEGAKVLWNKYTALVLIFVFIKLVPAVDAPFKVTFSDPEIKKYQTIYVDVILDTTFQNTFDTRDVQLHLNLSTPYGEILDISGFYHSDSLWQIRYTPDQPGKFTGNVFLKTLTDTISIDHISFDVLSSQTSDGFIRMNPKSNFSFLFDSGKIFRGIGENVCWAMDYEYYFKKLKESGCNITRIWMCPWNLRFEWSDTGIGRYNLESAARLDSILQLAEKYGIYIMLVFDYHGVIQKGSGHFNENTWADNPYNSANGGPCKESWQFFTNSLAKEYYKNRLRYLISRYAHSPMIHSWEFWNEVDLTTGRPADVIDWHCEMSAYLRSIDPYDHLITSSFANPQYPDMWLCPDLDFSQHHIYGARDLPYRIEQYIKKFTSRYSKPHFIGEYGVDFRGIKETREADRGTIGIHNGLWAGLTAATPIIPMTWWWDNLIDPDSLYYHFETVSRLWYKTVKDTSRINPLEVYVYQENARLTDHDSSLAKDLTVYPIKKWGKNTVSRFEIDSETGWIKNYDLVPYQVYGSLVPEWRNPPEFIITYQDTGRFTVHIDRIQHHGKLNIFIDDSLMFEKALPMEPGKGEYEEIHWVDGINRYQGRYNKTYSVNVPPGTHAIRVENGGLDYFEVSYYKFEKCGITKIPNIEARAISIDNNALIWLRNSFYTWRRVALEGLGPTVSNVDLVLPALGNGDFTVEWWDAWQGRVIDRAFHNVLGNAALMVKIPPLQKDLACRIVSIPALTRWELTVSVGIILLLMFIIFWVIKRERVIA